MGQTERGIAGLTGTPTEQGAHRPGSQGYVPVGAGLVVMTLIAVTLAYTRGAPHVIVAVALLVLAAVGVLLEAMYFMHLRVDRRMFSIFFGAGVAVAIVMGIALTVLLQFAIPAHGG